MPSRTTDTGYPPTHETTLKDAHADAPADSNTETVLAWAVDQWGGDARVAMSGLTVRDRERAVTAARTRTTGETTDAQLQNWLTATCLDDAPWIPDDGDATDPVVCYQASVGLPPVLWDWVRDTFEGLNDLSEGN